MIERCVELIRSAKDRETMRRHVELTTSPEQFSKIQQLLKQEEMKE